MNASIARRTVTNVLAGIAIVGAGLLTGDALFATAPSADQGQCRTFTGAVTIVSCAPMVSPTGAEMIGPVEEDGSAGYTDGLVYDAEDGTFRPAL